jgi:O-antigen/teichoic acid export membrane protein
LPLVQIAVLARLLSPEDFGLIALVSIVVGLAQVYADAGQSGAIIHRQDATSEQLSSLFWLNLTVGVLLFGVLLALGPLVESAYRDPRLASLIGLAALAFLVAPLGQQPGVLLQKSLRFDLLAAIDVIAALAGAAASIALAFFGEGVYALVWGQLATVGARTAAQVALGRSEWRPRFHFRGSDLQGYLRFGYFQMAERTINFLGANLDKLLIASLIGAKALGHYSLAYQIVMRPMQVINPVFTRVAFPLFAKVQTDDGRLRAGFLDGVRGIAFLLFPVYAGLIALAEPLTLVLLGPGWEATAELLRILAVLGFFYSLGNPIGSLLMAKGKVELGLYLNVWRTLVYAIAIWLGARWGAEGVASALVVATACAVFPVGFLMRRLLIGMGAAEYLKAFLPMLLASALMAVALMFGRRMTEAISSPAIDLMLLAVLGAVIYLAIVVPWQRAFFSRVVNVFR